MVDLMDLLRDVLVCSLQVWMLNDFGKNMFPYRVGSLWKRIGVYFAAALCIFIANHMGTTLFNITIIPVSYTIAAIIIFQGSKWKKVIMACCYYMLAIIPEFLFAAITEAYGVTGTANEFQSELEKTLAILLMKTMTFLLVKCINQITRKNFRCVSSYIPKVYTGKMRVFDCESAIANFFPSLFSEDKKTWEQYAQGEFLFDTMKGDHISCMNSPYIEENVKKILDL